MAEKTLYTRIALRFVDYGTEEYTSLISRFDASNPLLKGEVVVVNVPAASGAVVDEPAVLLKVGDGVTAFADLPWMSAKAADVHEWAKKESLDFNDLSADFITNLENFIGQKAVKGEIETSDGKALIFNEADGGGAKFEGANGYNSFVGVNSDTQNGIGAQIYDINASTGEGSKLDVTANGIYYVKGAESLKPASERDVAANELVTRKDIEGGLHYIGKTELADGETIEHAINRVLEEHSHTAQSGDIVIIETADAAIEYIYDGSKWQELGKEGIYATKAELEQEISDREDAIDEISMAREPEYVEGLKTDTSCVGVLFANGTPIEVSDAGDGVNNIITYYGENGAIGTPNTMTIPYNASIFGGGDGRVKGQYYANSQIVVNGGQLCRVFGGGLGASSVGVANIVINDGSITKGVHGGGQKGSGNLKHSNSVGFAKIIMNGGALNQAVLSAGGVDAVSVGNADVTINNGSVTYLYGSGSNGTIGSSVMNINGGNIGYALSAVRGTVENVIWNIEGKDAIISNLWAATDGDTPDTGIIKKTIINALSGTITSLLAGTVGADHVDYTNCSGTYLHDVIVNEATAVEQCKLVLKTITGNVNIMNVYEEPDDIVILDCNI